MSKQIQIRRGTTNANDLFVGAEGEMTMDTTTKGVRIHDGTTVGGFKIDTVVMFQAPTPENGYTWVRKYASGWVEQGGKIVDNSVDGPITITLPVTMADTNYYIRFNPAMATSTGDASNLGAARASGCFDSQTTTTITVQKQGTQTSAYWEVKGMAA